MAKEKKTVLTEKQKKLKALDLQMEKNFPGKILKGEEAINAMSYKRIPTASMEVNFATYGGFCEGKVVELFGPEDSGKTYFVLETIALNMKKDPDFTVAWVETEGDLDLKQIIRMYGIDINRFRIIPLDPVDGGEAALEMVRGYISSSLFDIIVINTVAGLVSKDEVAKNMDEASMALQARMMSKFFRVEIGNIFKTRTCMIFINQERETMDKYKPRTTGGGVALRYYSTQRIRSARRKVKASTDKVDETKVGKYHVSIQKNRAANGNYPYRECEYFAEYGVGISKTAEIVMIAKRENIGIEVSGAWYYYPTKDNPATDSDGNLMKFNGAKSLRVYLENHPEFLKELEKNALSLFESGDLEAETIKRKDVKAIKDQEMKDAKEMDKIQKELEEKGEIKNE
jgi:recombination protein RecA